MDDLGMCSCDKKVQKLIPGYGAGAAFYKHVHLGDTATMGVYLDFVRANVHRVCAGLLRGKRLVGLGYLLGFLSSSRVSYQFRLDSEGRQYVPRRVPEM